MTNLINKLQSALLVIEEQLEKTEDEKERAHIEQNITTIREAINRLSLLEDFWEWPRIVEKHHFLTEKHPDEDISAF